MTHRPNRPSIRSRVTLAIGLAGLGVIAMAARMPAAQTTPAQPAKVAPVAAPVDDSQKSAVKPGSAKADTAMVMNMPMNMPMPAAAPVKRTGPGGYPIDEQTGQTLINGVPVVGRVFIMQKTDGTVKIASVKSSFAGEPPHPLPPVVKASYTPASGTATRRMRGIMIQATLWSIDAKRKATRERTYGPSTPASTLMPR